MAGVTYLYLKKPKKSEPMKNVEILKNALLTFALSRMCKKDFDDLNMNYASFDGTKLPMLSGANYTNALCTYIICKEEYRKGPFYTKHMENKLTAIEKYLQKQFDSHDKIEEFLTKFVECCAQEESPRAQKDESTKDASLAQRVQTA